MKKIVCLLIVFVSLGVIYGDSSEALMSNNRGPNSAMAGAGSFQPSLFLPPSFNNTDPAQSESHVLPCGERTNNTLAPTAYSQFASGGPNQGIR